MIPEVYSPLRHGGVGPVGPAASSSALGLLINDVVHSYSGGGGRQRRVVIDHISERINGPKFITLCGPNGCGKTTLLGVIAGLINPDSGNVEIAARGSRRPGVGHVWQDFRAAALPWYDVAENIAFPLRVKGVGRRERRRVAEDLLARFAPLIRPSQRCYELSGGQQQMISILRSFAVRSDLLLLDEPLAALDQQTGWNMVFQLERIWLADPVPTIMVSHDLDEGILLADEIWLMSRRGRIAGKIAVPLPRPRDLTMLTSAQHGDCRAQLLDFFLSEGIAASLHPA